ncbi:MAG TPA: HTTM domain-containing protein [Candidatus Binatia bacterium]|nr:HTTM domain-containing protein [Candidatus Binatia bacterium]
MALATITGWLRADEVATGERGWALDLALFRVVLLGAVVAPFAWRALQWTSRIMPGLPRDAWVPISFFAWLPIDLVADARLAWWLALANLVLVLLALAGVRTRLTLGAATILSLYVFGLMENTGKVDHYHHVIWFMALLAIGPSDRFLALDARGSREQPTPGGALTTLRAIWVLFGLVYLGPGIAKLLSAVGDGWASAERLRILVWSQWFARSLYQPGFVPPRWLDALPSAVLVAGGIAVIAFEVGFVWLVLFRHVRPVLAAAGVLFHLVNGLVLGIWFAFLLPAYVALVDWAALGRRAFPALADGPRVPAPAPRSRGIAAVALVLVVAQAGVSAARLLRPDWAGPRWPFDLYPTFTSARSAETTVWEPRVLLADGHEPRVDAAAWARAFGSAARSSRTADAILREPDPLRRRARSRDVAALLWDHEPADVRAGALGVTVYEARYTVASRPVRVGETLLYRFAPDELAARR